MTIIIPTKGSATSGLLDLWQAHIQQQQADKAQTNTNVASSPAKPATSTERAQPAKPAQSASTQDASSTANAANASNAAGSGDTSTNDGTNNGTNARRIDTNMVDMVSGAREGAKQTGKAVSGGDVGGSDNGIVAATIKKLKEMLAKVMAQLDAVRNNDRLPPEEKLQQTSALSAQAMSIQAQIMALMDPTKTKGTHVDTSA